MGIARHSVLSGAAAGGGLSMRGRSTLAAPGLRVTPGRRTRDK